MFFFYLHTREAFVRWSFPMGICFKTVAKKRAIVWLTHFSQKEIIQKPTTGYLRYLKLGCLENPTYVELIPHSQASLPICYCISTLLVSNMVMTKTRLCRSDNSLPTEKRTLVSPFLCQTSKSKIGL